MFSFWSSPRANDDGDGAIETIGRQALYQNLGNVTIRRLDKSVQNVYGL